MPEAHLLEALFKSSISNDKARYRNRRKRDFLNLKHSETPEWQKAATKEMREMSFRDAIDRYAETILPRTRPGSNARHIRNYLYRFRETIGEDMSIRDINVSVISSYRDTLVRRGLANASINRSMDEVYSFLRCCREDWLLADEIPRLKQFPEGRRLIYLSKKEERRLLEESPEPLRHFLIFLLGTGARKSEALNLKWEDVEFSKNPKKRSWVVFHFTKNGRPHSVPLPKHVTRMLKEMKSAQPRGFPYVFSFRPKRDLRDAAGEFVRRQGVTMRYTYPHRDIKSARDRAGLPKINLHTCRHTYATRLILGGIPLITVSKLLNHVNVESSLQYVHLSQSHFD
jgi:integrase